ncbi:MAG: Zn-dependent hydrolase [Thermoprotei archaeon]
MELNTSRYLETWETFSRIGESASGVNRLALNEHDLRVRNFLAGELSSIGAEVRSDNAGNIFGSLGSADAGYILVGSHMDSVYDGGRFDGMYGVVSALEVARALSSTRTLTRGLTVADYTNEEGARFKPSLLGSGVTSGVFSQDYAYARTDRDGFQFGRVLESSGWLGSEENRLQRHPPAAYIELHIEQGPVLEAEGVQIGVPTGIPTMEVFEVELQGESNQAGPTPMSQRKDALVAASELVLFVRNQMREGDPEVLRATVGELTVSPNVYNVIPGHVTFTLDARSNSDRKLAQFEGAFKDALKETCSKHRLAEHMELVERAQGVEFNPRLVDIVELSAMELGYKTKRMLSWAGHDAQYISRISPTSMIFIPSKNGRSHCKEEYSSDTDLVNGFKTLLETVKRVDKA